MDGGEKADSLLKREREKERSFKARPLYVAEQRQTHILIGKLAACVAFMPELVGGCWRGKGRPSLLLVCCGSPCSVRRGSVVTVHTSRPPFGTWLL